MSAGPRRMCQCYLHFLPTASATTWFVSLIYDFHEPGVSSSLGHSVPDAVNISRRHTTSIFLSKTKLYGYNFDYPCRYNSTNDCLNTTIFRRTSGRRLQVKRCYFLQLGLCSYNFVPFEGKGQFASVLN
jgi:hypothetical protein